MYCSVCSLHLGSHQIKKRKNVQPTVVTMSAEHSVQAVYPNKAVSLDCQVEVGLTPHQWIQIAEKSLPKSGVFGREEEWLVAAEVFSNMEIS